MACCYAPGSVREAVEVEDGCKCLDGEAREGVSGLTPHRIKRTSGNEKGGWDARVVLSKR